jgi:hypothetical protein
MPAILTILQISLDCEKLPVRRMHFFDRQFPFTHHFSCWHPAWLPERRQQGKAARKHAV